MTQKKIFNRIGSYYDTLIERHGHSPLACDYGLAASQEKKFKVLSEAMPLNGKSVLDVGCGFGDFAGYLTKKYKKVRYKGIDVSPSMVKEAKKINPSLDVRFCNVFEIRNQKFDFVTANGIFYLLGPQAPAFMKKMISHMFGMASEAVAFNSLSAWAPKKEKNEFYADPLETMKFCKKLTPWVVLRHDYHPRDFTIYLYKEKNS